MVLQCYCGFSLWWQRNQIKIIPNVCCWKHLYRIPVEHPKSLLGSFRTKRKNFLFHFHPLGMRFHTISLPLSSHQPWSINISPSQSIFIIKHAQCSLWLWGHRAFIYSSYLFIFLSWGQDVGFYPSVLIAGYYRALRASPELARGEDNPQEIHLL